MEVAKAEANLRAARAFYYEAIDAAWQQAQRGEPIPLEQRRDLRLATTHAVQASVRAVDAMYTLAGGSSVYDTQQICNVGFATCTSQRNTSWWHRARSKRSGDCCSASTTNTQTL